VVDFLEFFVVVEWDEEAPGETRSTQPSNSPLSPAGIAAMISGSSMSIHSTAAMQFWVVVVGLYRPVWSMFVHESILVNLAPFKSRSPTDLLVSVLAYNSFFIYSVDWGFCGVARDIDSDVELISGIFLSRWTLHSLEWKIQGWDQSG
jgi:hypothetical protein